MLKISLKAARVNAELTQKDVAKALNVSNSTIVSWEKYATSPDIAQAQALCALYNIPYDNIIFLA